jgi:hypothetical protein
MRVIILLVVVDSYLLLKVIITWQTTAARGLKDKVIATQRCAIEGECWYKNKSDISIS